MRLLLLLAIVLLLSYRTDAASFTIAQDGKSAWSIGVPENPSPPVRLAAEELARYIEKMSGARLPIVTGEPHKGIFVCETGADAEPSVGADGYVIDAKGNCIRLSSPSGRGTLYATYDLLDRLGCRFLAPDLGHYQASAEYVPKTPKLAFTADLPIIESPRLAIRKLYVEEGHSHNAENLAQIIEWMPKARFNTLVVPTDYQGRGRVKWDNWRETLTPELQKRGLVIEVGGHGYQNFLNAGMENGTLFEKHPEWFGMDEEGKRRSEHGRVFCVSNDDAADYLINNFLQYVRARPEIQTYAFWPPDGASWCACLECKEIGSPADQQAYLLDKVVQAAKKVRPDLRLEIIAYARAIAPPDKRKLDKSVLVDFCPIRQNFEAQIYDPSSAENAEYVKQLRAWRKAFDGDISIYSYYRKYAWVSLPVLIPHYMQNDLQWYAKLPTQGVSSYAEPGDWFTYELNHYALGNLAWNPEADVDAIVEKFCKARYGSAAQTAMKTFAMLEEVVRQNCSIPGTSLKTAEELARAEERLAQASSDLKAATRMVSDPVIERNMDRIQLMLEYARLDMEVQKARAEKLPKAEIRKRATAFADFAREHADDGVIVFHSRHDPPRLFRDYGVGD